MVNWYNIPISGRKGTTIMKREQKRLHSPHKNVA